ncbi:MAG: SPFH domain-containing protein [Candidatus Diapherotrites archaeon]|nr:SPFH domain-containing protein [Candidatus Diapherotrites archaeon]
MEEETTKQAVFVAVVLAALVVAYFALTNLDFIIANLWWVAILVLLVLVAWWFDFGEVLLMLQDYQRAVIMRFGKVVRVGGPGWCTIIPGIEQATIVDLRTQTVDVPKQDVITKENIELQVDAVIYLRVKKDKQSVIYSVVEIDDYKEATKLYLISSIRAIIGTMTLPEVISTTEDLETKLQHEVEKITAQWGIEIVSVDFKDIDIPPTVLNAMHEEKAAVQQKLARMEGAQAHIAEIEAVKKAAEGLSDKALAYYYIQALEKLGEGQSTKIIFPMELSRLAESIGKGFGGGDQQDMERLFRRYAPAITGILSRAEKKRIEKQVKKKAK